MLTRDSATLPAKAYPGDLGYDLYSCDDVLILPGRTELIPTGIACQFPLGYGGLIRDRSSVAVTQQLFVVAGVIDNGYTGEIKVALHNGDNLTHVIKPGQKIAQIILIPTVNFDVVPVSEIQSFDGRSAGGFGSTGA